MRIPIPFVTIVKNGGLGASTLQTVQITMGAEKGAKIKKIVHSVFNATETKNTAIDHSNGYTQKVTSYYTTLDSNPLQIMPLDCTATVPLHKQLARQLFPRITNTTKKC